MMSIATGKLIDLKGMAILGKRLLTLPIIVWLLSACSAELVPIKGCDTLDDIKPVCNMQTPEDIAVLADNRHLLLAHYGGIDHGTGSLSLFDTQTNNVKPLYPLVEDALSYGGKNWGDTDCPQPDSNLFRPHGTHLQALADGSLRYLVVNHGGRESIEMFEFILMGSSSKLVWQGCILAEPETFVNDVVGFSNGDVIFSRMYHESSVWVMLKSITGRDTGDLWRWSKELALKIIPGTAASQPNGLEVSADEKFIFANMYMEHEVWKIDVQTGEKLAAAHVTKPDNSAWSNDGQLWIASHTESLVNMFSCIKQQSVPCGAAFEIVSLDPNTMATTVVFAHQGAPMGAATIAVPQAGRVYLGAFVGDRLISVPNFDAQE